MTKRERILRMIGAAPVLSNGCKMLSKESFAEHGFYASIEDGDKWE